MRWLEAGFAALAAVAMILLSVYSDWNTALALVVPWGVLALAEWLFFSRCWLRRLPDVPESAFLAEYRARFGPPYDRVLVERKNLAEILGVPASKLSAAAPVDSITDKLSLLSQISYRVGMGNLEDELLSRFGRKDPILNALPTKTFAEMVHVLIQSGLESSAPSIGSS